MITERNKRKNAGERFGIEFLVHIEQIRGDRDDAFKAVFLLEKGVRTIALDFLSLDMTPANPADAKLDAHYLWSKAGGVIGENFMNLRSLTNATPIISLLPLNMGASDGGPVRAVALSDIATH